jgi:hypothetical protein
MQTNSVEQQTWVGAAAQLGQLGDVRCRPRLCSSFRRDWSGLGLFAKPNAFNPTVNGRRWPLGFSSDAHTQA